MSDTLTPINEVHIPTVIKNDTRTQWDRFNPVLLKGEMGIEFNDEKTSASFRIGDGETPFVSLESKSGPMGDVGDATSLSSEITSVSKTTGANSRAIKTLNDKLPPAVPSATVAIRGTARFATDAEAAAGTLTDVAITPPQLKRAKPVIVDASTTEAGLFTIATDAEVASSADVLKTTNSKQLKEYMDKAPIGSIVEWPGGVAEPSGWLSCNGGLLSKTVYGGLYSVIGDKYNVGTVASDKFMLPKIDYIDLGIGNWSGTGSGVAFWNFVVINPTNGDVWACVSKDMKVLRGGTGTWVTTGSDTANWNFISVNSNNGDVWACVNNPIGEVKVLRGGTGTWQSTGSGAANWKSVVVNPNNGDVWACGYSNGEVKVLRGGTGSWQSTGSGAANWLCVVVNPTNNDVWACASGGEVKVLRGGTGSWTTTGSGTADWYFISVNPTNGDVWASIDITTEIKILRGGIGSWTTTGNDTAQWYSVAVNPTNNDVWACGYAKEVKVIRGGTGSWQSTGSDNAKWKSISINPTNGDVWACVSGGEIKKYTPSTVTNIIKAV